MIYLDADFLLYKIGFGTEDLDVAIDRLHMYLDDLSYRLGEDDIQLFLSCPSSRGFRRLDLDPSYKIHRTGELPTVYNELRKYMEISMHAISYDRLEADDVISIYVTHESQENRVIVASMDKDFLTVPCTLLDIGKFNSKPVEVSLSEADYNHAIQTLTGDAADGFKGAPGIGPVKAEKLLKETSPRDRWGIIVEAYESKGLTEEDALLNARLAFLLRGGYYDIRTRTIKLWEPSAWDYDVPNEVTVKALKEDRSTLESFDDLEDLLKGL